MLNYLGLLTAVLPCKLLKSFRTELLFYFPQSRMLGAGEAMPQGWLNQGMKQPAYPLILLGLGEASREVQGHFFGVAACTKVSASSWESSTVYR